jgi:transposase
VTGGRRREDGFTGFKTATTEQLPDATAVMDPFHVVRLAGDALDQCRRRVQQRLHGHRGHAEDPLYRARRTLHTGEGLLTDKQRHRLVALFTGDAHVEVEATWGIYQRMVSAYREPDKKKGRDLMVRVISSLSHGVPGPLVELITLGRTLKRRAADVLAYFDRPGTSNGPTEAINGRLEHLRGSAGALMMTELTRDRAGPADCGWLRSVTGSVCAWHRRGTARGTSVGERSVQWVLSGRPRAASVQLEHS